MAESSPLRLGGGPLRAADRLLMGVETGTAVFAGAVIFAVMCVGVSEIFMRKLFNHPLYGQLDLIELSMSSYALLTVSFCWRLAGHIRVDILVERLQGRGRLLMELLTTLAALVLITAILPGILHFFQNAYEIGDSTINTRWPTWPSKLVPILGFGLLWLRLALEILGYARLLADPGLERIAVPERHSVLDEAIEEAGLDPADRKS